MKPVIIAVGYNRPDSLHRLLESVGRAQYDDEPVTLIISLDKADDDHGVLDVAERFVWTHGEKIVRTFEKRQGLRRHIIGCGDLTQKYGAAIILEDDLYVAPGFYQYVCQALAFYGHEDCVAGIALYSHEWNEHANRHFQPIADGYDTYLGQFSITWGQCWTKESWAKFRAWYNLHEDKLGSNSRIPDNINRWSAQSWGRYFVNYITETDRYYVIPRVSLSTNFSEVGQHSKAINTDYQVRLMPPVRNDYRFAPCDRACRYDIYFENMHLSSCFPPDIAAEGVDIDLNDTNRDDPKNRYLLSTGLKPYRCIKTYGLSLRPIDMNILWDMEGESIFLYDKRHSAAAPKKNTNRVTRYEIRGVPNRKLLQYMRKVIWNKITGKRDCL